MKLDIVLGGIITTKTEMFYDKAMSSFSQEFEFDAAK